MVPFSIIIVGEFCVTIYTPHEHNKKTARICRMFLFIGLFLYHTTFSVVCCGLFDGKVNKNCLYTQVIF